MSIDPNTAAQLRSLITRVERLHEERKALGDDIRDVFAEAKGSGFDTTAMKACIKLRLLDPSGREERETIVETYMAALSHVHVREDAA